jgi:hypothetical protein
LKINEYKERIVGGNIFASYKALDQLTISAGYTGLNFKIDVNREQADGFFKWGYNGPSISATYQFGPIGKGPGNL